LDFYNDNNFNELINEHTYITQKVNEINDVQQDETNLNDVSVKKDLLSILASFKYRFSVSNVCTFSNKVTSCDSLRVA